MPLELMVTKLDKKSFYYLGIIFVIAVLVCIGIVYYFSSAPEIETEEKASEHREYFYQNKVTSECSSETCWINDEGKKECTATFGKCQWINDEGVFKNFTDVVNMSFDKGSGDLIYSYKGDYSVVARLFLVLDVSQSVCEVEAWDWKSEVDACFLWWDKTKEFIETNGIDYDVIIAKYPDRYKYALSLTKIPQNYQDRLLYVGLRLEEVKGLKWEDLKEQERSLTIKNKISLGFADLIKNGFTYKLYDERTILIGNVSNKEDLWLDPIVELTTETSDGYIWGSASDYSTARGTSYSYSTSSDRMSIGQEYGAGECTGTVTSCEELNDQGDEWDYGDCVTNPGCYWEGCSGTVPCDNFDDDSYFCDYVGCSWEGCDGSQTVPCSTESYQTDPDFCEFVGCTWDGSACTGSPGDCSSFDSSVCDFILGCSWDGCEGTDVSCSVFDDYADDCAYFGCSWVGCAGTAVLCSDYTDESSCNSAPGQNDCSWEDEDYWVNRGYLSFDTSSSIPDDAIITDVRLRMQRTIYDDSDTDFDIEIWKYDWVEQISDSNREESYDADGPTPAAAVYDAVWKNTADLSWPDVYYTSSPLDIFWINLTGDTKYQLRSSRDVSATEPTDKEYLDLHSADSAGHEPILSITYTVDITPPGITITSIGGDSAAPYSTNDNTPLAVITTDENADCRASLLDDNYDLMSDDIDCTGDGGTSHNCQFGSLEDSASQEMHFACKDTLGNKNTNANNKDTTVEIDTAVPTQSGWDPAKGSAISTKSPTITFTLNEEGDCKWSLTDQAYDDMAGDCTGDGGTSMSCSTSGLSEGAEIVYIACEDDTDSSPNKDTAATNEHVNYTVNQSPDKPTGLDPGWHCCGAVGAKVALRTCLTLNWTYSDPDGDSQAGYEVWLDDDSDFSDTISVGKFNHVVDLGLSPCLGPSCSYTVNLAADDEGDWLDPPPLPGGLVWANTYHWKVKVKDSNGDWSGFSDSKSFTLPNRASPKVDFTPNPINPGTGERVDFIDDSKCYLSGDSEYDCKDEFEITGEDDISYEWDFGDGSPIDTTEGNTDHIYSNLGRYIVQLKITDENAGDVNLGIGMCWEEVLLGIPIPKWKEITPF